MDIDYSVLAWPWSGVLAGGFLILVGGLAMLQRRDTKGSDTQDYQTTHQGQSRKPSSAEAAPPVSSGGRSGDSPRLGSLIKMLSSVRMAQVLLAIGAVLLAIEGTWAVPVHRSPVFVVYVLVLLTALGVAILKKVQSLKFKVPAGGNDPTVAKAHIGDSPYVSPASLCDTFRGTVPTALPFATGRWRMKDVGFLLNHIGIFVILWAALFGSPDVQKAKMMVQRGVPENTAYTKDGKEVTLPFAVTLNEFKTDYYEDGVSPKQYTSTLTIGKERMQTKVNDPCSYGGYVIYQEDYDHEYGQYSVLGLVRDPWLPIVYIGIGMLAIGSVLLLFGKWKAKIIVPAATVLTILFTAITVAKINFGTLMPVLRSWWFVPHIMIYMVAYSLMAIGLVLAVVHAYRSSRTLGTVPTCHTLRFATLSGGQSPLSDLSELMVRSAAALLILGTMSGAIWAKEAWGDYWAWDPKENWAAVTWFIALIYLHLSQEKRGWKGLVVILVAFLALQITWYGVNYLPSAMESMHAYRVQQ